MLGELHAENYDVIRNELIEEQRKKDESESE
jgi:hypothetical protein